MVWIFWVKIFFSKIRKEKTVVVVHKDEEKRYKPAFYVPLRNLEAIEGQEVTMECVVTASPEAEVVWFRNNIPVTDKAGVGVAVARGANGAHRLTFTSIKKDQAG